MRVFARSSVCFIKIASLIIWTRGPRYLVAGAFSSAISFGARPASRASRFGTSVDRRSIRIIQMTPPEEDLGDVERWERMYNGGSSYDSSISGNKDTQQDVTSLSMAAHEIRVVTFDLDNTLWKTSATISAANDALAEFLDQRSITQPIRVEKIMGELFQSSKERYAPQGGKAPVLLTQLRKDALKHVLIEHNSYLQEEAVAMAETAFAVWTKARHDAIPTHYATSVVSCLERIGTLQTSSGRPILIGAVTDGNSDPRNIPELRDLFDFCVNAEGVGVSKPDKRVYLEALNQVVLHPTMEDIFGPIESKLTEEAAEDMVGPWWVHIGDDFVKDIVASKSLKMRSIWSRELVSNKEPESAATKKSSKTVEDLVKDVSKMKVIEMSVGADDYLADSLRHEFADAVVDRFDELHDVLLDWQNIAMRGALRLDMDDSAGGDAIHFEDEALQTASQSKIRAPAPGGANLATKFCMYCGTKVPSVAKFCSSCGEMQPELP